MKRGSEIQGYQHRHSYTVAIVDLSLRFPVDGHSNVLLKASPSSPLGFSAVLKERSGNHSCTIHTLSYGERIFQQPERFLFMTSLFLSYTEPRRDTTTRFTARAGKSQQSKVGTQRKGLHWAVTTGDVLSRKQNNRSKKEMAAPRKNSASSARFPP